MGGLGSGRYSLSGRATVEDYRNLDVRRLKRAGVFSFAGLVTGWQWSREGETIGSIKMEARQNALRLFYRAWTWGEDWREMDYLVQLERTPCHLGGERLWFLCPARGCGRRVAKLYGGAVYACRSCHGLTYSSQKEDRHSRALRRAEAARARLGWGAGEWGYKPKGMHAKTFERLASIVDDAENEMVGETIRLLTMFQMR